MSQFQSLCRSALAAVLLALGLTAPALALGPDSYLGTVELVGGSYCPKDTLEANGATLPIASFTSLYSLYSSKYGGDGLTNFGLPDLRSKVPLQGMMYCVVVQGKLPPHN